MGTVVGVAAGGGVVLGADRRVTSGGTVTGDSARRLFAPDGAGAAAAGDPGDVDAFGRRFEAAVREYRVREDEPTGLDRLAREAAAIARETGVEAVVAARDDGGTAGLRTVTADGAVLDDRVAAFGSGAAVALGRLDGVGDDADLDAAEAAVREALARAAARDPETGEETDVWRLPDA